MRSCSGNCVRSWKQRPFVHFCKHGYSFYAVSYFYRSSRISGVLFRAKKSHIPFKDKFFLLNRKLYVDRFYIGRHQFGFGRYDFLFFLLGKYLHSASRQRCARDICCDKEFKVCRLLRRNGHKSDRQSFQCCSKLVCISIYNATQKIIFRQGLRMRIYIPQK